MADPASVPPQSLITIGGRDSRIISTDLTFGATTVRYSTAEVLISAALDDGKEILVLYGWPGRNETYEVVFAGLGDAQVLGGTHGSTNATTWNAVRPLRRPALLLCAIADPPHLLWQNGDLVLTFQIPSASTYASLIIGSTTVVILDHDTAYTVWQPTLATDGGGEWSAFAEVGTNSSAVVLGPYLVRNASLDGDVLALYGDTEQETSATIFAPSSVRSVTWNGADVPSNATEFGILCAPSGAPLLGGQPANPLLLSFRSATLPGPNYISNASTPTLSAWRWADSLPEASPDYDDSFWTPADHPATNATTLPLNGSVALVATDYGFVTGKCVARRSRSQTSHRADPPAPVSILPQHPLERPLQRDERRDRDLPQRHGCVAHALLARAQALL